MKHKECMWKKVDERTDPMDDVEDGKRREENDEKERMSNWK